MKTLKTAVIGLGNMGRHHARHYANLSNLVAVCDQDIERMQPYACNHYTSLDDLLKNEALDAVTIAAPTHLHYDIAKKVIEHNISLLIEKPIADTIEKAEELDTLAKHHNVTLMVGHIERFNPIIIKLKDLINQNVFGQIASIVTRRVSPMPTQIKDANVLIDLAVHDIDMCSYLLGKSPDDSIIKGGRLHLKDRDDHAELLLNYGTANALIQVNWITPIKIRTLSLTGEKAHAELNYLTQELTLFTPGIEPQIITSPPEESLALELTHFLNAVATKIPPLIGAKEGIDALRPLQQTKATI